MPRDYLNDAPTRMRRDDRAVTDDAWIIDFLQREAVGTLATAHDNQPYVNTNLFVYDPADHSIIFHTARVGRTRSVIEQNPQAVFTVMQMGRLLPADEALEFSVEYVGVSAFGTIEIIDDEDEALAALQLVMDKYAPHLQAGDDYRPPVPEELPRTSVFRLNISDWVGKKKEVEDFPGAFWHDAQPMLISSATRTTWQGILRAIQVTPKTGAPVIALETVEAIAGKGLRGDHRFDPNGVVGEVGYEAREITLIAAEDIAAVRNESGLDITAELSRRNLLVEGVPLNHLVGQCFRVGDALLKGIELCEPCNGLALSTGFGPKLISAMLHRGGLRAIILESGTLHTHAPIRPVHEPEQ